MVLYFTKDIRGKSCKSSRPMEYKDIRGKDIKIGDKLLRKRVVKIDGVPTTLVSFRMFPQGHSI